MLRRGLVSGVRGVTVLSKGSMQKVAGRSGTVVLDSNPGQSMWASLHFARSYCHNETSMGLPRPQDKAPDFTGQAVVNKQFKQIKLSDYKGKWLLFFFYPLDFTFVCPTEIIAFSDQVNEFKKINCEVVACSTDSHFTHLAWINTPRKDGGLGDVNMPVLSDYSKKIASDYGVLLPNLGAALRGLFVIDPNGVLKHVSCNDLPVGRSVEEALRLVKAFQFVEKHGEVCPANWKEGSPSIKPGPETSKEYFNKVNK